MTRCSMPPVAVLVPKNDPYDYWDSCADHVEDLKEGGVDYDVVRAQEFYDQEQLARSFCCYGGEVKP